MSAQVIHISDRSRAIAAMEAERETLLQEATRITAEQMQIMQIAFDNIKVMGKRQEEILLKLSAIDDTVMDLMIVTGDSYARS